MGEWYWYQAHCKCGEHLVLSLDFYWYLVCEKCGNKYRLEDGEGEGLQEQEDESKKVLKGAVS
ncbi:hypothetical protein COS61_00685 [Candidatus Wolfebacteria bacterium CG03_land_8_20_14_0_80_40_12]|uniref:Uncharacterized protein n=1 Tax=Candidatus Wolfebacteria bacterium CG03_land_8_20_14_0_80_40_12 TaxID=1975069 RepID=A0A2M7B6A6_9BACT|nr:MAG: hypothetical protein COS61_00685 [Candidatus Wolfebacteria bacterium CG03_land_8_20_14_0_80_40_12]